MFLTKKGFSLFTALVSLLLISISLILIFNMLKTEDTYLSMIEDQSSNSDLITIADLARADAFNSFIISLRVEWENFRNKPENNINLTREDMDLNWDSFVDKVAMDYFFERNFNVFFARTLINKLEYTQDVVGYKVQVDSNNSTQNPEQALGNVIGYAFADAGNKIDVVNCSQESDNCTGSFYFKLSTIGLSDQNFEYLPTVTVIRFKNNEVIQRPVLSRAVYKIYMPWRGFQAMRVARRIAYSSNVEKSENPSLYSLENNYGLFNPRLHNTLEQARLGVCDPNSCAPRSSFFRTVDVDGFEGSCSSSYEVPNGDNASNLIINDAINIFTPKVEYTLGNMSFDDVKGLFNAMIIDTVSDNLDLRSGTGNILFTNSLKMNGNVLGQGYTGPEIAPTNRQIIINEITTNLSARSTKMEVESLVDYELKNIAFEEFDASTINSISGGLGLFYDNVSKRGKYSYEIDDAYNDDIFNPAPSSVSNLKCYELDDSTGIVYDLVFKETNPKYIVGIGEPKMYINLYDGYSGFTYSSNQQPSFSIDDYGYIQPFPTELIPNDSDETKNQWVCADYQIGSKCYAYQD